jgi:hypothetical protein
MLTAMFVPVITSCILSTDPSASLRCAEAESTLHANRSMEGCLIAATEIVYRMGGQNTVETIGCKRLR